MFKSKVYHTVCFYFSSFAFFLLLHKHIRTICPTSNWFQRHRPPMQLRRESDKYKEHYVVQWWIMNVVKVCLC